MTFDPDFDIPWCQDILNSEIKIYEIPQSNGSKLAKQPQGISNTMFIQTLYTPTAIRAQINFERTSKEPDSITGREFCYLLSIGTGLDGKTGRAHGGFNALILDHITGTTAAQTGGSFAPATATMTVDYKAPIDTPQIIISRAWAIERTGRKTWVKGVIEDGTGKLLASCKALFIDPKGSKM